MPINARGSAWLATYTIKPRLRSVQGGMGFAQGISFEFKTIGVEIRPSRMPPARAGAGMRTYRSVTDTWAPMRVVTRLQEVGQVPGWRAGQRVAQPIVSRGHQICSFPQFPNKTKRTTVK